MIKLLIRRMRELQTETDTRKLTEAEDVELIGIYEILESFKMGHIT